MMRTLKPVMAADGGSGGVPKPPLCPKCKKASCTCPPSNDPK